jgi:hypothetical protein
MQRLLKYVMKAFYANESYAKYRYPGMNYFMALTMATIYIMLTCFLITIILFCTGFIHAASFNK